MSRFRWTGNSDKTLCDSPTRIDNSFNFNFRFSKIDLVPKIIQKKNKKIFIYIFTVCEKKKLSFINNAQNTAYFSYGYYTQNREGRKNK